MNTNFDEAVKIALDHHWDDEIYENKRKECNDATVIFRNITDSWIENPKMSGYDERESLLETYFRARYEMEIIDNNFGKISKEVNSSNSVLLQCLADLCEIAIMHLMEEKQ